MNDPYGNMKMATTNTSSILAVLVVGGTALGILVSITIINKAPSNPVSNIKKPLMI